LEEPRALHLSELRPHLHRCPGTGWSRLQDEVQDLWPRDRGAPCGSGAAPRAAEGPTASSGRSRSCSPSCSGSGGRSGCPGCSRSGCPGCSRSGGGSRAAPTEGRRAPRGSCPARRACSPEAAVSPDAKPALAPAHVRAGRGPGGPRRRVLFPEPGPGPEACNAPGGNPCPGCASTGGFGDPTAAGARSHASPASDRPAAGSSESHHRGDATSLKLRLGRIATYPAGHRPRRPPPRHGCGTRR
jgi:hypothetical protein